MRPGIVRSAERNPALVTNVEVKTVMTGDLDLGQPAFERCPVPRLMPDATLKGSTARVRPTVLG